MAGSPPGSLAMPRVALKTVTSLVFLTWVFFLFVKSRAGSFLSLANLKTRCCRPSCARYRQESDDRDNTQIRPEFPFEKFTQNFLEEKDQKVQIQVRPCRCFVEVAPDKTVYQFPILWSGREAMVLCAQTQFSKPSFPNFGI